MKKYLIFYVISPDGRKNIQASQKVQICITPMFNLFFIVSLMKKLNIGPLLIMIAAGLWAVDGLIRVNLSANLSPTAIVFFEHLIGFAILSPLFLRNKNIFKKANIRDWALFAFLALVSSVGGTLFFTEALARAGATFDFTTPTLLQKLQPIFVISMSLLFLKEKINMKFVLLAITAFIGSYLISFGANTVPLTLDGKGLVYVFSIGAAFLWGTGTIISKKVLGKFNFEEATLYRFGLAIPISAFIAIIRYFVENFNTDSISISDLVIDSMSVINPISLTGDDLLNFILIALFTGAGAILLYYKGLKTTEAKVATIAELTFPIVSILIAITSLNPYGDPQNLDIWNIIGILILIISMLLISLQNINAKK